MPSLFPCWWRPSAVPNCVGGDHSQYARVLCARLRISVCQVHLRCSFCADLYAHRSADDAYRDGYDLSTFGRHHLDYAIAITLKALRRYDGWRRSAGKGEDAVVDIQTMVDEARLGVEDAHRLHEVLLRMRPVRGRGASVYRGSARRVGEALPSMYSALVDEPQ